MVAKQIELNNVEGETAELGVFKGDFAQFINRAFPSKKLYLFDTFEGFGDNETIIEMEKGNANKEFVDLFCNASVEIVMKKMKYPSNVIIKKGYFPETVDDINERFSFVSLDADFEKTTLEGLRYFYPKLSVGGYIFLHDYNYCDELSLEGIRSAVAIYEKETGIKLNKVPICDQGGTLIIVK